VYAGCCYAPMDGTMPVHRLNSILNTLDTDLMIVQRAFYDKAKTLDFSGTILIAEELLDELDAPVERVCGLNIVSPFSPVLEDQNFPHPADIVAAVKRVLNQ